MPDRVIRDELLESERWLGLKDNADRLAYVALLLRADTYGNRLDRAAVRVWRRLTNGVNRPGAATNAGESRATEPRAQSPPASSSRDDAFDEGGL
jgi:hypothetical protein